MAKQSGLGHLLFVSGYNLSGDICAVDEIGGGNEPLDVTAINKSAHERIGGVRDGRLNATSYFNPASNQSFDRYSNLPTTDQIVTYCAGQSLGSPAASLVAKQFNFDGTRGEDGAFTFKIDSAANAYGLEWGELLTAGIATFGGASAGSSLDYGASVGTTAFGLQAYLHVFAFTGTSATITIQSSTDDAVGDPFALVTGATFTTVTGVTAERIATATNASVERYLRVNAAGTFSLLWFSVQVVRNLAAPTF